MQGLPVYPIGRAAGARRPAEAGLWGLLIGGLCVSTSWVCLWDRHVGVFGGGGSTGVGDFPFCCLRLLWWPSFWNAAVETPRSVEDEHRGVSSFASTRGVVCGRGRQKSASRRPPLNCEDAGVHY